MTLPELNLLNVFLAALPILVVLYLMIGRSWGGSQAGPAGWATAVLVGLFFFGGGAQLMLVAWGKAIFLSLFVLYIIWMALLLYHTVNEAGVIQIIGEEMPKIAQDKPAQALLLAWIFGSFLQGATGFGVPAAVVAPLLVGLGFAPNVAVVAALLGHAWAVTFGSLGSSFLSLIATTGVPGEVLAGPTAVLLGICCLGCGLGVLWFAGGGRAIVQRGLFLLVLSLIMGLTQWVIAQLGLYTLASFLAGFVGLVVAIGYFIGMERRAQRTAPLQDTENGILNADNSFSPRRFLSAFGAYFLLIVIIVVGQVWLQEPLDVVELTAEFPAVATSFGWATGVENGRSVSLFGHAGALLLYTSLLTYGYFSLRGPLLGERYVRTAVWRKTLKGSIKPTIGVYTLVAMALTMQHTGMTQLLAETISRSAGAVFPLLSPFIGALGAFMTGSNTNSNVVFGQLQQQTALVLNLAVPIVLAGQTAGGAIGGLFAPAKVIVGSSTVEGADDGEVLKLATVSGMSILLVVGLIVWFVA